MTRDAADYVYDYDYENRLTKISHDSVTIATYAYDALNRRIENTTLAIPARLRGIIMMVGVRLKGVRY